MTPKFVLDLDTALLKIMLILLRAELAGKLHWARKWQRKLRQENYSLPKKTLEEQLWFPGGFSDSKVKVQEYG